MSRLKPVLIGRALLLCLTWTFLLCNGNKNNQKLNRRTVYQMTAEYGDDHAIPYKEFLTQRAIVVAHFMVDCLPAAEGGMAADTLRQCRSPCFYSD